MKTIHLQSIGEVPAILVTEVKPGDVRMYNFGSTSIVVNVFEKTEKTLVIVTYDKEQNKYYASSVRKTSYIPIVKHNQDVSMYNPTHAIDFRAGKEIIVEIPQAKEEEVVEAVEVVTEPVQEQQQTAAEQPKTEDKIPVTSIEFVWSESNVKNNTIVKTFAEANDIVRSISAQEKPDGGYSKTQIKITFEDDSSYSFRYDIQYNDSYNCNLTKRVTESLETYAGLKKPGHMTEEEYKNLLNVYGSIEQSLHLLEMYSFEDVEKENEPVQIVDVEQQEATTQMGEVQETTSEAQEELVTETPTQEEATEEIDSESKKTDNNIRINLNNELNGVEIYFPDKPSQEVIEQLKINKFRWSKRGFWYTKQNEKTISFANSLVDGSHYEGDNNHSLNDGNNSTIDSQPFAYPDIDINDIECYTVNHSLQDREHDASWIFRKDKRDRTAEIQSIFTDYNNQVVEVLETTDNERIKYYLKKNLQSFKKKYFHNYVKMLSHRASNPSWAVTGRGGMNVSRYNKMQDRYDKLMGESVELTSWIDSQIKKAKSDIRRDKEQQIKKQIEEGLNNTEFNLTFTTQTKEVTVANYTSKVRTYNYQDYMFAKSWGCFRIFYNNKEIHSMKTTETLQDAKKYVCYLVSQDNQKAV